MLNGRFIAPIAAALLCVSCSTANTVKQNTADLVYRGVPEDQRAVCVQEARDKTPWIAAGAGGLINVATTRSLFKACMERAGATFDEAASEARLKELYPR